MAYVALYRSYRPKTFSEVVGQKHIIKTLKNAVMENRTSHAYIFSGLRGIGKTTIARILAKAVNCENPVDGEPCNVCKNCLAVINDETTDIVELDAASNNGVDEMRDILEKVNFLPSMLRKKVYIIDEAHMLSSAAFNALLKTLEEPPLYVMFILATTEPHKIPQTILSRCQRFDFKQLANEELVYQLKYVCEKEQIKIDDEAINAISESAEGGMRDALSILDQASAYATDTITIEDVDNVTGRISKYKLIDLVRSLKEKDANKAIHLTNELINMGKEASRIVGGLIQFCRDLLLYKDVSELNSKKYIYSNEAFQQLADELSEKEIFYYIDVLVDVQNKIKFTNSQTIYIEVGILKIVNSADDDLNLLDKIQKIEAKIGSNDSSTSYGGSDYDVKINNLENKIKKVSIDLEKADLENFKEKMESKMDLIEDVSSKNATLPSDVVMRFDSIEDRLRLLSIDVQGSNALEVKELMNKVKELEQKVQSSNTNEVQINHVQDIDVILEQLASLEKKVNDVEENLKNKQVEDITHLTSQITILKEQIDTIEQTRVMNQQIETQQIETQQSFDFDENNSDNSIELANEIAVLKEKIQQIEEQKVQIETSPNQMSQEYDEVIEQINQIKEQIATITSIPVDHKEEVNLDVEERMKNIEEFLELLSQKVDEMNLTTSTDGYESELGQLKENYFSIVGKLQEMLENSALEKESTQQLQNENEQIRTSVINLEQQLTKLEERITSVEKTDVAQDAQINLIKGKLSSSQIVQTTQPKENVTPNRNTQGYVRPVEQPRIVETNETKTLQTIRNVYDIRIVERILHESRQLECREEKGRLAGCWSKLEDKVGYVLAPIAKVLHDGKLVANGKKELLIVYPTATICNHLMEPKNYADAKQVLRITLGRDYDFLALPENTWQEKRTEYIGQHSIGIVYPKLTPINNPELNVVIPNYEQMNQKQKRPLQQAKSFFGNAFVEEEKE